MLELAFKSKRSTYMSITTLSRFMLIALFLFSYQNTTIHSKHHHIQELSECKLCHATAHSGQGHHQQALPHFSEHTAIETHQLQSKEIKREAFSWSTLPLYQLSNFDGLKVVSVQSIAIGYFSTAPPTFS